MQAPREVLCPPPHPPRPSPCLQVTCLHGLHLVDTPAALDEAARLLKPHGTLLAAWNDRDLADPFVDVLEQLFEKHNQQYK